MGGVPSVKMGPLLWNSNRRLALAGDLLDKMSGFFTSSALLSGSFMKPQWILCVLAGTIQVQSIFGQITNTVTVPPPPSLTLNDVTITTTSGPGIQANENGAIDASNIIITTTGVNGFGA